MAAGAGVERPLRVLILGGGFGGVYTALELERRLGRDAGVEITLINRDNFFLFTPLLHEVAASDLDLTHIVNPTRKLLRRTQFVQASVTAIDLPGRAVDVVHGDEGHRHRFEYDRLVIALGSVTNFFGLPGLAERAVTMKSLGDAIHLRNRLIANLEQADYECAAPLRTPLLTVVVAGGGFAGVETAAAVYDFLTEAVGFYRNLRRERLRLVLVHSGATILPELGEALGRYAGRKLAERGIDIRTDTRVESVDASGVRLSDGETVPARTLVWTAGTTPNPLLASIPCALDRGRIRVDARLEVPEWPGVYAVGDCAAIPAPGGGVQPPTAQHALREGAVVAQNILAERAGRPRRGFAFGGLGQLAAIGRRTGVARVLGVNFSGFLAWWLWRTIYLAKLPRLEKKLRVMLDWTLDLVFSKDLVQFETGRTRASTNTALGMEQRSESHRVTS
jgi:NADH dehydrogenase